MDTTFTTNHANVFAMPDCVNFGYKNDNFQMLDYNNLTGFDNGSYTMNGDLFNDQSMMLYDHDRLNTMNCTNLVTNEVNSGLDTLSGLNSFNNGMNDTVTGISSTQVDDSAKRFENYYNTSYLAHVPYETNSRSEVTKLNLGDLRSVDQFCNYDQSFNQQYGAQNMAETSLIEPVVNIGEVNSEKSSNSQNYSFQSNYQFEPYNQYAYYGYTPFLQDGNGSLVNSNYVTDLNDSTYPLKLENLSNKGSQKDELESVANASTCDNTPILKPSSPNYLNTLSSNYNQNLNATNTAMSNGMNTGYFDMSGNLTCGVTNGYSEMNCTTNNGVSSGYADMNSTLNAMNSTFNSGMNGTMNNTLSGVSDGLNVESYCQDLSDTQLVKNAAFYYPAYCQYYYSPAMSAYGTDNGYEGAFESAGYDEGMNESIIEIANEIANNVQYLPEKDSNGKYSLDKNHPIHCVWRDVNRGHCSWRCRWWENGKRLSKNFNVKRFGDFEAMRMAITMKIRNSTPVERIQLLKEQREAVRNQMQLYNYYPSNYNFNYLTNVSDVRITKVMNNSKKLQRENWNRLSWTYLKLNKTDKATDSTIICRLCSKTTRCSRSRNLQQAHIMHLIRMHKNPWKQYIDPNGLTKMCKLALDALYEQNQFRENQEWNLRPGIQRPEPSFT